MGAVQPSDPFLLVVAAFSRHSSMFDWAEQQLQKAFGPIAGKSAKFEFDQTRYYEPSMGPGLRKEFVFFQDLVSGDRLPAIKILSNEIETAAIGSGTFSESRPLNLDPGLLSLGKFVLATTKDQSHRIYLAQGIFAEVTLRYHHRAYEAWPWTYADYRQPKVLQFFNQIRTYYRSRLEANKDSKEYEDQGEF